MAKTKEKKISTTHIDGVATVQQEEPIAFTDRVRDFLQDERPKKITGLLFLFFGILTVTSLFSYLSTWKEDQDEVFKFSWSLLFNGSAQLENKMGRLGAILSHEFIYNGFGLAAFVLPYLFLVVGVNLMFSSRMRKMIYNIAVGIPIMFMSSTLLSLFMIKEEFAFGGGIGNVISTWLQNFIGFSGTLLSMACAILIGLVLIYNINFSSMMNLFKRKKNEHNQIINSDKVSVPLAEKQASLVSMMQDEEDAEDEEAPYIVAAPSLNELYAKQTLPESDEMADDDSFLVLTQSKPLDDMPTRQVPSMTNNSTILEITPSPQATQDIAPEEDIVLNLSSTSKSSIPLDIEVLNTAAADDVEEEIFDTDETFPYDPTLDLSSYKYPTLDLLIDYKNEKGPVDKDELQRNSDQIIQTLNNYNIEITQIKATVGPTVTLYEIVPAAGVRISKIKNLEDDIALSLSALGIRIIAPIPGKGTIGIEVPNIHKEVVSMRSVLSSSAFANSKAELPVGLGKTISNEIFVADLAKMPHLLMAGATGQGKSVGLNALLASLLFKKHPSQLKFVLVDPKKVELSLYSHIEKHFLAKLPGESDAIITDTKKVISTLNSLCIEMDERYDLLKQAKVRNIIEYNQKFIARKLNPSKGHKYMPYIVLVVDEFADLIMTAGKEIEMPIARLAQLARAIGIHLIIATQRPSVNIITGTIKANFPARIAFKVSSKVDSRTILDAGGADQLIGKGDMLISNGGEIVRVQCAFLDLPEVESLTNFIGDQRGYTEAYMLPEFLEEGEESNADFDMNDRDKMFEDAARVVVATQQGSTSMIQRRLKLGYNRAGRIMDQLEGAGIVGPNEGSKAREVLVKTMEELEHFLNKLV